MKECRTKEEMHTLMWELKERKAVGPDRGGVQDIYIYRKNAEGGKKYIN